MPTSISTIKGMNPGLAAKLKAEGITNTDQLQERRSSSGMMTDGRG